MHVAVCITTAIYTFIIVLQSTVTLKKVTSQQFFDMLAIANTDTIIHMN